MKSIFKKTILAAMTAALVFAAFPFASVFAQGENPPAGEVSNEKLERAWARQLKIYERLGKGFDKSDEFIAKVQEKIDEAAADGKDVAALQAALDAFKAAVTSAGPIYDDIEPIVTAHDGFDADGKVTDSEKAQATVQAMRGKLQELKSVMNSTGRALRDAIKAFRQANQPAESTSDKER